MTDIAVRVENLGKRYRIGQIVGYSTLRESLMNLAYAPFRHLRSARHEPSATSHHEPRAMSHEPSPTSHHEPRATSHQPDHIWALKDVSFEIKRGEAVGIIGRNGSGKSTLLKILSRITAPTEGLVEVRGRIASLLEVGTGFHPELTGRENIYLNGAVLGMKRAEVKQKFDEIVAFSEIEKFLDTPVKRYSSGMYVRLAFAVAAHLEPEILLVDEVLAVGDAAFQKKCLGKMGDVAKEGRTVLFVSHNLGSVVNICPRAILLVAGEKHSDGPASDIIGEYIETTREGHGERIWSDPKTAPGNEKIRLHAVRIVSGGGVTDSVDIQKDIQVEVEFWNLKAGSQIHTSIHLLDKMGVGVLASANFPSANLIKDEWYGKPHPVGLYRTICTLPGNFLNEGLYSINAIVLTDGTNTDVYEREVISFTVHESGAMRKEYGGGWLGVVRPRLAWQTEYQGPLNRGDGA